MEAAAKGKANVECLVGSTEPDGDEPSLKTLDSAKLTSILWCCVKDLSNRLTALETANSVG